MTRPVAERHEEKYTKGDLKECWEWTAAKDPAGYGRLWVDGVNVGAHRVAWELYHKRPVPFGMTIMHDCDNPGCQNPHPGHLVLGTYGENSRDAVAKGRWSDNRGERNGKAKLTNAKVRAIRASDESLAVLAQQHGVGQLAIHRVRTGVTWAHVA